MLASSFLECRGIFNVLHIPVLAQLPFSCLAMIRSGVWENPLAMNTDKLHSELRKHKC